MSRLCIRSLFAPTLALGLMAACAGSSSQAGGRHRSLGKPIVLTGIAGNAKISAHVESPELSVYCLNRPSWKKTLDGKRITVRGTLEYTDAFAATKKNGEISQGTDGGVYVIRNCELVDPPEE